MSTGYERRRESARTRGQTDEADQQQWIIGDLKLDDRRNPGAMMGQEHQRIELPDDPWPVAPIVSV